MKVLHSPAAVSNLFMNVNTWPLAICREGVRIQIGKSEDLPLLFAVLHRFEESDEDLILNIVYGQT